MVLITIVSIPLATMLYFYEYGFLYFGQDPIVSSQASIYVMICNPGILFFTYASCFDNFLSGHRDTAFIFYSNLISTIIHIVLAYYLVVYRDMRMIGISLACSFYFFCRFLTVFLLIKHSVIFKRSLVSIRNPDNF